MLRGFPCSVTAASAGRTQALQVCPGSAVPQGLSDLPASGCSPLREHRDLSRPAVSSLRAGIALQVCPQSPWSHCTGDGQSSRVMAEVRSCWELSLSLLTRLSIAGPNPVCVHRVPSMGCREQAESQPLLTPVAQRTPQSVKDKEAQIPLGYPGQASAPL